MKKMAKKADKSGHISPLFSIDRNLTTLRFFRSKKKNRSIERFFFLLNEMKFRRYLYEIIRFALVVSAATFTPENSICQSGTVSTTAVSMWK